VELRVQDTGVGIPPEALPRLFERFYRVQDMRSRTYEGSGIGLALVQELLQLHGGTVRVHSQVDQGSTFVVTLPFGNAHLPADKVVAHGRPTTPTTGVRPYLEEALHWLPEPERKTKPADGRPDPAEAPLSTTSEETARPRVLVVDDNADMRQYIARLLSDRYHVTAMPEGMAALIEARRQPPDLILSDIMMPQLDGFGLLQALRDDPALKTIPVILLSARAGEESRIEGLGRGADDYLVKPFGARELLARVATHLDMARVRREAQKEIAHSEARFEAIVSQATAAVAQTDLTGRFLFVNQRFCMLLGYSESELLGMNMQQVTDPEDLPANLEQFHRLTAGGPDFVIEKRYRRKDGSAVWTRVSVGGVREDGELRHILAVGLDITDRKRQEAELLALTHRQSLLYDLADVVNRAETLTGLYEKAIDTIIEALHADRASILLFDDEGVMRFEAWRGLSQAYREAVEGHAPWIPDQQDPPAVFIP
jgi:PAS domain S-box-containing protein